MWYETPPPEEPEPEEPEPEEPEPEEPQALTFEVGPMQLLRDQRIPFDHARAAEYLSGEVPPGWNEPLP